MHIKEIIRIIKFDDLSPTHWVFIFVIFFIIHIPVIHFAPGNENAYEFLAKSLSKGQLSLSIQDLPYVRGTHIANTGDLIFYQGKYYLPYPPAPAIILMPFVMIAGGVNSILIALCLSCLNLFLIYLILKKIEVENNFIPWIIYGFFFGTSYWFVLLSSHHVYGFAEVVSVTGVLLLLNELFGEKRALLMGLFLGIAFLSRQFTSVISVFVLGYFIYWYLILPSNPNRKVFWRKIILFSSSFAISIVIYFIYNYVRFGNPLESGYKYIAFLGVMKERVSQYGVFSSHYVLYNLYNYLFKGFNIEFTGKDLLKLNDIDLFGTALLIASPFLIASFKSGWHRVLRIFAWFAIGTIFVGLLFYHNNGKDQVNASRFTLDFLPIMLVLTGKGCKNIPGWLFKSMICYSIILNIIAMGIHFMCHTYPS